VEVDVVGNDSILYNVKQSLQNITYNYNLIVIILVLLLRLVTSTESFPFPRQASLLSGSTVKTIAATPA